MLEVPVVTHKPPLTLSRTWQGSAEHELTARAKAIAALPDNEKQWINTLTCAENTYVVWSQSVLSKLKAHHLNRWARQGHPLIKESVDTKWKRWKNVVLDALARNQLP